MPSTKRGRRGSSGRPAYDVRAALRHLRGADPVLGRHIARVGGFALELRGTADPFMTLAEAIVHQQLSGKAAATIFGRLTALYPDGGLAPDRLLTTGDETLRGVGLSRAKLASLRDLAARSAAGSLPSLAKLRAMDDHAIIQALTEIRGVGRWTVEMLLMFRLGRPDVLPLSDYGIRKGFARVFRRRGAGDDALPPPADVARRGERWRPYRSVASWYLWRALDVRSPPITP